MGQFSDIHIELNLEGLKTFISGQIWSNSDFYIGLGQSRFKSNVL